MSCGNVGSAVICSAVYRLSFSTRSANALAESAALFDGSTVARDAFGDEVVDHYLNNARVELDAFNFAVTDWERRRGFERL